MTETEFDIYRRLDNDADSDGTGSNSADTSSAGWTPDELVGRVTADSVTFTDTDPTLQPGTEYEYAVAAHNEAGDGFSAPVDVTTAAFGSPPNAPSGVAAQGGANQVTVTWTAPTPKAGVTVTSFDVYRQNAVTAWAGNTTTTWTLGDVVPVLSGGVDAAAGLAAEEGPAVAGSIGPELEADLGEDVLVDSLAA